MKTLQSIKASVVGFTSRATKSTLLLRFAIALGLMFAMSTGAMAAEGDFEGLTQITTQITSWQTIIKAGLGVAFATVVIVVGFQLAKRFLHKAA